MKLRKMLSALLAAVMVCSLISISVFAAEEAPEETAAPEVTAEPAAPVEQEPAAPEEPAEPVAPAPAPVPEVAEGAVKINVSALNVRSGHGVKYPVVAAVHRGDICEIVESAYGWGKLADGSGWICLAYTKPASEEEPAPAAPVEPAKPAEPAVVIDVVEVNVGALHVRSGHGVDYPATSVVHRGDICEIVAEAYGWGKLANGKGWIYLGCTKHIVDEA